MEQLIQRLIDIGYKPSEANDLYGFYDRMGDLDGLESYVVAREAIEQSLVEFRRTE